ncbi:MAG: membrane protein insertion efficiency factor YidD [Desulfobacterales bacterium]
MKGSAERAARVLAQQMILGYQLFLSPFLGRHCRFYPSCSEYTKIAIQNHGLLRGCRYGVGRLLKCHPFNPGGFDPVP